MITNLGTFVTGQNQVFYVLWRDDRRCGQLHKDRHCGTQTLAGNTTYTGATSIGNAGNPGGTLLVNATMSGTSVVNVGTATNAGALGGSGIINAPVSVAAAGILAPHTSSTGTSTLTIGSDLTVAAGASLNYNFGTAGAGPTGGIGDLVKTTGTGSINLGAGTDTLNVGQLSGFGIGTYPLLQVTGTGTLTDNATFTILGRSNFTYKILKPGDAIDTGAGAGNVPAGEILLEVLARKITWLGNLNGNWDTATANWNGDGTVYTDFSVVTFDDTASGTTNLTVVPALVQPNAIIFNNSAKDYTIGGNAINVSAVSGITKNQAGAVTLNNSVTTPTTSITAGAVNIGKHRVVHLDHRRDGLGRCAECRWHLCHPDARGDDRRCGQRGAQCCDGFVGPGDRLERGRHK